MKYLLLLSLVISLSSCSSEDNQASLLSGLFSEEELATETEEAELLATGELNEEEALEQKEKEEEAFEEVVAKHKEEEAEGNTIISITYPKVAKVLRTHLTRVVLWGDVAHADEVVSVEVNGFQLTRYKAGDKEFSYIASEFFGTLQRGENNYEIKAFNKEGELITETTYTIISDVKYLQLSDTGPAETLLITLLLSGLGAFAMRRKA